MNHTYRRQGIPLSDSTHHETALALCGIAAADFKVVNEFNRETFPGVVERHLTQVDGEKRRETFILEIDRSNPELHIVSRGNTTPGYSRNATTLDTMRLFDRNFPDEQAVGAVNADFFEGSGIAAGLWLQNGLVLSANIAGDNNFEAIGFKKNGDVLTGKVRMGRRAILKDGNGNIVGTPQRVRTINTPSYPQENNTLSLFNSPYTFSGTQTTETGPNVAEWRFKLPAGATNESIYRMTGAVNNGDGTSTKRLLLTPIDPAKAGPGYNNSPIKDGEVVVSILGTDLTNLFSQIKADWRLEIETYLSTDWLDVYNAAGGRYMLVVDGQSQRQQLDAIAASGVNTSFIRDLNPRTFVCVKNDSIDLIVVDGRQPTYSDGISLLDAADELASPLYDCDQAINLDGGGSSTIAALLPGDETASVLNKPSDGSERAVVNSLLVTTKNDTGIGPVVDLEATIVAGSDLPFDQTDNLALAPGASITLAAIPLDAEFNEVPVPPGSIVWSTSGGIGTITQSGVFVANSALTTATDGEIVLQVPQHQRKIRVRIDVPGKITFPTATVAPQVNESIQLQPTAFLADGNRAISQPGNFEYQVIGDIGTVDENGVLTAGATPNTTGKVIATFGAATGEVGVLVNIEPVVLDNFDSGIANWNKSAVNVPAGNVSIAWAQSPGQPVRFGQGSMQMNYDFSGTTGTVGAYAGYTGSTPSQVSEAYPTGVGVWVYGDGKGAWLRALLRDADNKTVYLDFTNSTDGINWTGWQYVQAPVPAGLRTPLKLDQVQSIRIMGIATSNPAVRSASTIYVDNYQLVFGEVTQDTTNPLISQVLPASGSTSTTATQIVGFSATDPSGNGVVSSGINPASAQLFIDNVNVSGELVQNGDQFAVQKTFTSGVHSALANITDNAGNITTQTFTFTINTGQPYLVLEPIGQPRVGEIFRVAIKAVNGTQGVDGFNFTINYDPKTMTLRSVQPVSSRGNLVFTPDVTKSGNLQMSVSKLRVTSPAATVIGMVNFDVAQEVEYTENANSQSSLFGISGNIQSGGTTTPFSAFDITKNIAEGIKVAVEESIVGEPAILKITGAASGKPIADAKVSIVDSRYSLGTTLGEADLTKDPTGNRVLARLAAGTELLVVTGSTNNGVIEVTYRNLVGYMQASALKVTPLTVPETSGSDGILTTSRLTLAHVGDLPARVSSPAGSSFTYVYPIVSEATTDEPSQVTLTWSGDPKTTQTVSWVTSTNVKDSPIRYRVKGTASWTEAEGSALDANVTLDGAKQIVRARYHTVTIEGLKNGTAYEYQLGNDEDWSQQIYQFRTAPDAPAANVSFIVLGDTQSPANQTVDGNGTFAEVVALALKDVKNPAFIAHVGDLVDYGDRFADWREVYKSIAYPMATNPFLLTPGNHEFYGEMFTYLFRYNEFDLPGASGPTIASVATHNKAENFGSELLSPFMINDPTQTKSQAFAIPLNSTSTAAAAPLNPQGFAIPLGGKANAALNNPPFSFGDTDGELAPDYEGEKFWDNEPSQFDLVPDSVLFSGYTVRYGDVQIAFVELRTGGGRDAGGIGRRLQGAEDVRRLLPRHPHPPAGLQHQPGLWKPGGPAGADAAMDGR